MKVEAVKVAEVKMVEEQVVLKVVIKAVVKVVVKVVVQVVVKVVVKVVRTVEEIRVVEEKVVSKVVMKAETDSLNIYQYSFYYLCFHKNMFYILVGRSMMY